MDHLRIPRKLQKSPSVARKITHLRGNFRTSWGELKTDLEAAVSRFRVIA